MQRNRIEDLTKLDRSYFLSLTVPDLRGAEGQVTAACDDVQLIELRVDLLESHQNLDHFKAFVEQQVQLLRGITTLDILYTVRTKSQGGAWPDSDTAGLFELYQLGLQLEVDFLDVELQLPDTAIQELATHKGSTLLLMSHHDWSGSYSWNDNSWLPWYEKGVRYGDGVKLVGTATSFDDNLDLEAFRSRLTPSPIPLIAINMGAVGKLSRVLNRFLTPVTHPALTAAAPGQLSVLEIRQAMGLLGLS